MEKDLYKKDYKLFNSYFDINDNISPKAILTIFQDIAGFHGEKIGVGYENMLKRGLFWVTARVKFDVIRFPKVYEEVEASTWPHAPNRFDFDRDYVIKNKAGEVLIKGTSKWCVISTSTRKISTMDDFPCKNLVEEKMYEDRFARSKTLSKEEGELRLTHTVNLCEIDHNKHLNNTFYADYIYRALEGKSLKHLQINFIQECVLGDKLDIYTKEEEEGILVAGYENDNLKFTALAVLK